MQGPKDKKTKTTTDGEHEYQMSPEELQQLNPTVFAVIQGMQKEDPAPKLNNFNDYYCYNNPECFDCSLMEQEIEALEVLNDYYEGVDNTVSLDYLFDDD